MRYIKIIEKSPAERNQNLDPLSRIQPKNDIVFWSLGMKWSKNKHTEWYGFWGEYAEPMKPLAYIVLGYYAVMSFLGVKRALLSEAVDPGRTFFLG